MNIISYYIVVKGLSARKLTQFVRRHFPSTSELVRRARLAKLPEQDNKGKTLHMYAETFTKIPTGDEMLVIKGKARVIVQTAIGQGPTGAIRRGLAVIIQRHLTRELRQVGYRCRSFSW